MLPFRRQRSLRLSVVVVAGGSDRQLRRTLQSLDPARQHGIAPEEYEVLLIESEAARAVALDGAGANVRLVSMGNEPLPIAANRGVAEALGEVVCMMIDGTRIASPGLLHLGEAGTHLQERAVVATLDWTLGFDYEAQAVEAGYSSESERATLEAIGWPDSDCYQLFDIATMDRWSTDGWFSPIPETNALFLRRELWEELGGYDEGFQSPGGGLANADLYARALALPGAESVILLGEATFRQLPDRPVDCGPARQEEYTAIRGRAYAVPDQLELPTYVGRLPRGAMRRYARALTQPSRGRPDPLGPDFDRSLWRDVDSTRADPDHITRDLIHLMDAEFEGGRLEAALGVARLIRPRAPAQSESLGVASLLAGFAPDGAPEGQAAVAYHVALAKATRIMGDHDLSKRHCQSALALDPDCYEAHVTLASLALPGDDHARWLQRIYEFLTPHSVLEVGVQHGVTLALAPPEALAVGVDPTPLIDRQLVPGTVLFAETSDEFFAAERLERLLGGAHLGVAFIDGLHIFEQALRDFANAARYCGAGSAILLHDTLPLDEATQSRDCDTAFHTGDVWRTALAIRHLWPQLELFTVAAPFTGLTVVTGFETGFDPEVGGPSYEEAVRRFLDVSYDDFAPTRTETLNVVANDWDQVRPRLEPLTSSLEHG